jgi:hypothetical protein
MPKLFYRRGNVFNRTGTDITAGASYSVNVYRPGAQVTSDAGGGTIVVRPGHGIVPFENIIVGTDATAMRAIVTTGTSTNSVAYTTTPGILTTGVGALLVNLGKDTSSTSSSTRNFDGASASTPALTIYSDMDGATTPITNALLTTNSDGEYEYWHDGTEKWEVVRTGQTIKQIEIVPGNRSTATTVAQLLAATTTISSIIPAGSLVLGVTVRVFQQVTGATSFQVGWGSGGTLDDWGATIGLTVSTVSTGANFTQTSPLFFPTATSVLITANGSNFTGGRIQVTVHYLSM